MIPETVVREISDGYGADPARFEAAIGRLRRRERRLVGWIREQAPAAKSRSTTLLAASLLGLVLLMYERVGRIGRPVRADDLVRAEAQVKSVVRAPGTGESIRAMLASLPRSEPIVLDEALRALFEHRERSGPNAPIDDDEAVKVYLLLWVATEALSRVATAGS